MCFTRKVLQLEQSNSISIKKTRHVRYKETCDVILIPSKEEYVEFGIQLWYKNRDFEVAMAEAKKELRVLLESLPLLSFSSALTLLYQPSAPSTIHATCSTMKRNKKMSDLLNMDTTISECFDSAAVAESLLHIKR